MNFFSHSLLLIVSLLLLVNQSFSKRKSKKKLNNTTETKPIENIDSYNQIIPSADSIRPSDISPELFCDICQAILIEANKHLRNLHRLSDILYYTESDICFRDKYKGYHFSLPEMEIACEVFFSYYNDELVIALLQRKKYKNEEDLVQYFCYNRTKACNRNIILDNIKPIEAEFVDGEIVDVKHADEVIKIIPDIEYVDYYNESKANKSEEEDDEL